MPGNACRAGLRVASRPFLGAPKPQKKWFSTTLPQSDRVLSFPKTSSPELDDVLSTIRYKILLPAYLPAAQRKKLWRPRYAKELRNNPIQMEIEGEAVQFYPIDPHSPDVPVTRKVLFEAVDRMETAEDWAQLRPLLEGLHYYARHKLRDYDYAKMTRRAGLKGQIRTIINCAQLADRTGFRLDTLEKVQGVMRWLVVRAVDSGWDVDELAKSLRWAEEVVDLAELQEQQRLSAGSDWLQLHFPLHRHPLVLSTPLYLAAALAIKRPGSPDVETKAARYARDLVALWPENTGLLQLHDKSSESSKKLARHVHYGTGYLLAAAPMLSSLELAMDVVDAALAQQLAKRRQALETEFGEALAKEPSESLGRQFRQELLGFKDAVKETSKETPEATSEET